MAMLTGRPLCLLAMLGTIWGLAALAPAYGHVNWKPALLFSDAAYELGFGLFALSLRASELLSPLCFLAMLSTI